MTGVKSACGGGKSGEACQLCGSKEPPRYWCEVCEQAVPDKRCPLCGLKTRKIRL
jgi:Zn finger protein HypA/HybF involved in hydrogenase expression